MTQYSTSRLHPLGAVQSQSYDQDTKRPIVVSAVGQIERKANAAPARSEHTPMSHASLRRAGG